MLKCVISIAIVLLSICSGQLRIVRTGNSIKLERGSLEVEERSSNSHPALKASGDEAQSESDILSEKEKRTKKGKGRGRLIDGEAQSESEILLEKEKKLKREKGLFGALKDANSKARGATSRRQRQIGEGNSDRVVEHEDIEHPVGPIAVVGPMKKVKMCVVVRTYHGHRLEIEIMLRSLLNQHPVLHRSKGVKRQRFHFEFFVVDTQPAFGDSFGFNSYLDEVIERIENTYNEAADYFKVHNLLWDGHKVGTRQQVGDVNAQTTLKKELRVYGYDATDWLRYRIVSFVFTVP
jgi:hypothetical protein